MIAPEVVATVNRLLGKGLLSHREIARSAGINRETVGIIARGQRPDYEALRRARKKWLLRKRGSVGQRCPECHASVYLPCVACNTRKEMAKQSPQRPFFSQLDHPKEPLGLDLKERHRQRYEEIHARRLRAVTATDLEKPIGMAIAGDGERPQCLVDLLEVSPRGNPEKADMRISTEKEIESCFQWCGLMMRATLHRQERPSAMTKFSKAEVAT